ncbi:hypothetical protein TrST_g2598 [Triparma strigata]|uniref:ParB-like nuclease n=1 Tax=Triparma strigata TaxID=1606541 RepID=A0A9W7BTR7_9STRA|nr:hypothetical protein TrST_g2598 [Triparma strigata]
MHLRRDASCIVLVTLVSCTSFVLSFCMTKQVDAWNENLNLLSGLLNCDDIIDADAGTLPSFCSNKWKNLKPLVRQTQPDVGYAWVQRKLDKNFDKESDAQDEMGETTIPAVLGPGANFYIVDHHHTLVALDKSGYDDTKVTVEILCDYREMEEEAFWLTLEAENFVYPYSRPAGEDDSLPTKIDFKDLPADFSHKSFNDDHWRSLSSFVRKTSNNTCEDVYHLDDTCMRCFVRECDKSGKGIPFFEFRWAYYMNDAFNNGDLWGGDDDYKSFVKAYKDVDIDKLGKVKTSTWEEAAERLIPLCRWEGTGSYEVKLGGALEGSLPGVVEGWNPIDGDDPECDSPACTPTNQQTRLDFI